MSLSADEFLRRFVQHVLPTGFMKVRHYGLLANRHRQEKLDVCRQLLLVANVAHEATTDPQCAETIAPVHETCCTKCGSRRLVFVGLAEVHGPAMPADTS